MLHRVSRWDKMALSTYCHITCSIAAVSISHPASGTRQKFTTKYHDWVVAPQCMSMGQNSSLNLLPHFLFNSCSISQPAGGTRQKFTTKYHDWVVAPQCMLMGQNGSFNLLLHFLPNSCSISQSAGTHVRNSQQNITTEWMPHSVCRWAKTVTCPAQ